MFGWIASVASTRVGTSVRRIPIGTFGAPSGPKRGNYQTYTGSASKGSVVSWESHGGLDVHSKRSVFVIAAADGRVVERGDIPTTPADFRQLQEQLALAAETPVALGRAPRGACVNQIR